jgi:hypothetical protein
VIIYFIVIIFHSPPRVEAQVMISSATAQSETTTFAARLSGQASSFVQCRAEQGMAKVSVDLNFCLSLPKCSLTSLTSLSIQRR